ncbi:MAG: N-acetylornithine carbamoyltransferase [Gemmatimonadota bacterium]
MRHFTDLGALQPSAVEALLASASELERHPRRDDLRGRVLGLLFFNPSLRTLSSFQAGMAQLGGSSFVLAPGQGTWKLELREGVTMDGEAAEHIREAIPVLGEYCDVLGVRAFPEGCSLVLDQAEPLMGAVVRHSSVPVVNLESAMNHPCQALGDWKTLDDLEVPRAGGRFVLSWAYHPKALPLAVPSAVVRMAAMRGMDVTVLRPDGFGLPDPVMDSARALAAASGGTVRETDDREAALDGAHVLYAKSWQSPRHYGEAEAERGLRAGLRDWCVRESWFRPARPEAVFMHCLPVRRNVVVADEILDGPRSRVVRQAGNRLHVQKAILLDLLGGSSR